MMKNNRGFTLPEVLVAMAVGMVILTAIYAAVISGQRASGSIQRKVTTFQDARAALELMAMEIQMASYNPNFNLSATSWIWTTPNCGSPGSGVKNNRGIQAADPNFITIEWWNDALTIPALEIITYTYLGDAANLRITRQINCVGASFLGGALADGSRTTRVVNDINMNGSFDGGDIPVFRYFNGSGTEISPASLSTHISDIARIEIALVVETQDFEPGTSQRRRMIYSTSVIPRNHVVNQ